MYDWKERLQETLTNSLFQIDKIPLEEVKG